METGIELRFDVDASLLNDRIKTAILSSQDKRMNKHGVLILVSNTSRSQEQNKKDAFDRLVEFILPFTKPKKKRVPTKISRGEKAKRKKNKMKMSEVKKMRKRVDY